MSFSVVTHGKINSLSTELQVNPVEIGNDKFRDSRVCLKDFYPRNNKAIVIRKVWSSEASSDTITSLKNSIPSLYRFLHDVHHLFLHDHHHNIHHLPNTKNYNNTHTNTIVV